MDSELFILLLVPIYLGLGSIWYKLCKLEGKLNGLYY